MAIQAELLKVETELIREGLETAEALRFVDAMTTVEQLLPPVAVGELEPGSRQRSSNYDDEYRARYGGWTPPQEAAAALLSPSSASNRERKRQAIAQALAANPNGSDREIARTAGVDHKTVAAVRPQTGEIPTESGESPSGSEAGEGEASGS